MLKSRLASVLAPPEREFFTLLEQVTDQAVQMLDRLDELLHYFPSHAELIEEVQGASRDGSGLTRELSRRLSTRFVTPIEREDLHALGLTLDDLFRLGDDIAGRLRLYGVERVRPEAKRLGQILLACMNEIQAGVPLLRGADNVTPHVREVARLVGDGDEVVRVALRELFAEEPEPIELVRWKDLFERLHTALHACGRVGVTLEEAALKQR